MYHSKAEYVREHQILVQNSPVIFAQR